jgi:transcriptional antiterminator RfaH
MPILAAEPSTFPAELFSDPVTSPVEGRRWRVAHTKPRQEKALARQMLAAQMGFYLPLIERRTPIRGRLVNSYLPLFGGYCFVLANERERVQALATQRVVRLIEVADQERLWADLRQIHQLIASGLPVTPEGQLVPGATVEIRTGALAGLKGVIVKAAKQRRFVVQVDFIQQGASVELADFMITRSY